MLTRDPLAWMWIEACEMLDRAERLNRQFFRLQRLSRRSPSWEPLVDIFETDRELQVIVLLPGVTADRLTVTIEDDLLVVSGERPLPITGPATIQRLEIPYGWFEKRIALPSTRYQVLSSNLAHGCLILKLG